MKWVTRSGVRLDRCACIWLILRHIDPAAEILYREPANMVEAFAEGALPFHNTSAEEKDLAERTSFEMLVVEYGLEHRNPALHQMAEIMHGAELTTANAASESAGLRAIAKGARELSASDDEMVARMLAIFDALYSYCQRTLAGRTGWTSSNDSATLTDARRQ